MVNWRPTANPQQCNLQVFLFSSFSSSILTECYFQLFNNPPHILGDGFKQCWCLSVCLSPAQCNVDGSLVLGRGCRYKFMFMTWHDSLLIGAWALGKIHLILIIIGICLSCFIASLTWRLLSSICRRKTSWSLRLCQRSVVCNCCETPWLLKCLRRHHSYD